mmetsp:Transcript_26147/g.66390  ORF Transcript_26147/g.66390 Transcript_26147/m.66390 type:complete len:270 (+) Transcript_26147:402-1211(+)
MESTLPPRTSPYVHQRTSCGQRTYAQQTISYRQIRQGPVSIKNWICPLFDQGVVDFLCSEKESVKPLNIHARGSVLRRDFFPFSKYTDSFDTETSFRWSTLDPEEEGTTETPKRNPTVRARHRTEHLTVLQLHPLLFFFHVRLCQTKINDGKRSNVTNQRETTIDRTHPMSVQPNKKDRNTHTLLLQKELYELVVAYAYLTHHGLGCVVGTAGLCVLWGGEEGRNGGERQTSVRDTEAAECPMRARLPCPLRSSVDGCPLVRTRGSCTR